MKGHSRRTWTVAFSPDGKQAASGAGDETVVFWDSVTGEVLGTLRGHLGPVWAVASLQDGRLMASGSSYETVML